MRKFLLLFFLAQSLFAQRALIYSHIDPNTTRRPPAGYIGYSQDDSTMYYSTGNLWLQFSSGGSVVIGDTIRVHITEFKQASGAFNNSQIFADGSGLRIQATDAASGIFFDWGGSDLARFTSTGQFLFGVGSSSALAHIYGADNAEILKLQNVQTTPTAGDSAYIAFVQNNSLDTATEYVRLSTYISSITDAAESGKLSVWLLDGGSFKRRLNLSSTGELYVPTVKTDAFQLTTNASNGYVLTSDATGLGTWQASTSPSASNWTKMIDASEMIGGPNIQAPQGSQNIGLVYRTFNAIDNAEVAWVVDIPKEHYTNWYVNNIEAVIIHGLADSNVGNFYFELKYKVANSSDAFVSLTSDMPYTENVVVSPPSVNSGKVTFSIPITNGTIADGESMQFYLVRKPSNASDTNTDDFKLTAAEIRMNLSQSSTPPTTNPILSVSPTTFNRTITEGGSLLDDDITVQNTGTGNLQWTASESASWFSLTSTSGNLSDGQSETTTIQYSVSTLSPGNYSETIAFTSNANGQNVTVNLTVNPAGGGTTGDVVVTPATTYQTIRGFGAYVKWYDASTWNQFRPSAGNPDDIDSLASLFVNDAKFNIMRIPFPTGIEPVNDNSDPSVTDGTKFNVWNEYVENGYVHHESTLDTVLIKRLRDKGISKWLMSCWSPSPWMKVGDTAINSQFKTDGSYYDYYFEEYAEQVDVAIDQLAAENINVVYYSLINEPTIGAGYPSSPLWYTQFSDVRRITKPELVNNFNNNVTILAPEHETIKSTRHSSYAPVSGVGTEYDMMDWHGYNNYFNENPDVTYYTNMAGYLADRNVEGFQTEISNFPPAGGDISKADTYDEGLMTAFWMYHDIALANASAWIWWINWSPDDWNDGSTGNEGRAAAQRLVFMDNTQPDGQQVRPSAKYWAMTMLSRYVPENSVRVDATSHTSNVKVMAFKRTDGTVVVWCLNMSTSTQNFSIEIVNHTATILNVREYSDTTNRYDKKRKNLTDINISGSVFNVSIPPRSLQVFITANGSPGA